MESKYPSTWMALQHPWTRSELLALLDELRAPDPSKLWAEMRARGLACGFDEAIHFFFDDHDFDESDVGFSLFDSEEVRLIGELKMPLGRICDDLPEGDDLQSISHPSWPDVRIRSEAALAAMRER